MYRERKSVLKIAVYFVNMFTPKINVLCLVQTVCIRVCPHAAMILDIIWEFCLVLFFI